MNIRILTAACVLVLSATFTGFAAPQDDGDGRTVCQQAGWIGTYLSPVTLPSGKQFADQLQFNPGGSVTFSGSYYPEKMISEGTTSQGVGTWRCTKDGTIAATIFFANYGSDNGDLSLLYHVRATMIFTFLSDRTIRRDVMAVRIYFAGDPTDPNAGFIVNLPPSQPEYTKLEINLPDLGL